jgi:hypothetical protein
MAVFQKLGRVAKLSLFVGLGAVSAFVAACGGSSTQTPGPVVPEAGADADALAGDTGVKPDVGEAGDTGATDAPGSDASDLDADADALWDVPYE